MGEGLAALEPDALKELVIATTEETDPALLPADAPLYTEEFWESDNFIHIKPD